jgi:single-strand DNA-binding protein
MAEVTGKIKIIGELQTFASGFTKIQVVVTSDEQYPSDIPIEFLKDKADYLNDYHVGDSVKISVNIKGSEYQGKYYVGLIGWKVERLDTSKQRPPLNTAETKTNTQEFGAALPGEDNLPF